ncbi:MAG: tetratricopeptide repeat protein [Acidobacteria bacterium]|nr:tetratricopeptide repeat protein [Acidobacteriota bacterium]
MTRRVRRDWVRTALAASVLATAAACASGPTATPALPATPTYREVPQLTVPAGLQATPQIRARHDQAWRRLQSGDLRGANRDFTDILRQSPDFYPAAAGLGYLASIDRKYDDAAKRFDGVVAMDRTYLPALQGRMDVALARGEDVVAVTMSDLILAVDPGRDDVRERQEVLRLRVVQAQLTRASAARAAGQWDEAQAALDQALVLVPDSAVVLRDLAQVEIARGRLDEAEVHARRSLELDNGDAEAHAVMASVLEAHGRPREAAAALARAIRIDPRQEWRDRAAALTARADFDALPAEYRAIPSAASITRGQLAAILGIRLQNALGRAPRRVTVVVTDVRSHWAAPWILPAIRVGWMDSFPNHTFQPSAPVRRAELAQVVWRVAQDLAARQPSEVARWRASRPVVPDVSRAHLAYSAIAGALATGAMSLSANGRFEANRFAAGAEVVAAVARLEQLAKQ